MNNEKKFILTGDQMREILTKLQEMQEENARLDRQKDLMRLDIAVYTLRDNKEEEQ